MSYIIWILFLWMKNFKYQCPIAQKNIFKVVFYFDLIWKIAPILTGFLPTLSTVQWALNAPNSQWIAILEAGAGGHQKTEIVSQLGYLWLCHTHTYKCTWLRTGGYIYLYTWIYSSDFAVGLTLFAIYLKGKNGIKDFDCTTMMRWENLWGRPYQRIRFKVGETKCPLNPEYKTGRMGILPSWIAKVPII